MDPQRTERRLAAIFSADVAGYSRLMAENEPETVRLIKAHRDMMGGRVRQHAGRVVDAVGDNLLAEFELTESAGDVRFGRPRKATLKGISEAQRLYPVEW